MRKQIGTEGDENLAEEPDTQSLKNSKIFLSDLSSRELISRWRSGSEDAASILWVRYEVRLVALITARLNRRFASEVAADDVVQSAFGSFFRVTRDASSRRISLESGVTAWNILATFVRRKLSRKIEKTNAVKRGLDWQQTSLDLAEEAIPIQPSLHQATEMLEDLNSFLNSDQSFVVHLLLENASQKEIADRLNIDERSVRRRIVSIRNAIEERLNQETTPSQPPIEVAPNNLPNIHYNEFVLGKMVGRGAFGKVYKAVRHSNDEIIAVKFMHRSLWTNPSNKQSYLQEVEHASRINHPGIIRYHGWGQSPHGGPYIVSEYVDGHSLANVATPCPVSAVQWLIQICEAIQAAHREGVVHGDLTPNNILLTNDGRIVITDFGFAVIPQEREIEPSHWSNAAPKGGTVGFAAPEQISTAFGCISPATDIYAIGGLAYYFLHKCGPHQHQENSLVDTVSDEDVTISESFHTAAEAKLAAVANLALRKAVERRPKTVAELIELLSR